ncbi:MULTISPECIES: flagellar basal body-associated protein FliL [Methylovorus]|jgi:flagellar FliL protein|uniref:Flagellar protein FliL n=1 Tax=Methylovorus glucosotrophus (strain SIP3-4) TaxID=582744 RepID=C6XAS8_METGS|nr:MULTISPECIES: flagellar basal body-associated protein FliL [Methylovorus]ACT50010.1 flagellar basal body-associated protein FliL [Methylovorus glucosotrophus SIP3-4]ADQ83971.1 flagellar basal body-associated protein FliL [Methylovorus sp. MP688]
MAKDPKAAAPAEEAPAAGSKKKLIMIIVIALLVLGGGGGAAAWFFLHKPAKEEHKVEEKHEEAPKPPVFVSLETFTVNLQPDPESQFLQVDLTLKVADAEQAEIVKLHMPEIRNRLLMLLSSKKPSEVTSIEGKKALSDEIVAQVKQPFSAGEKPLEVSGVFFTSFVVQ